MHIECLIFILFHRFFLSLLNTWKIISVEDECLHWKKSKFHLNSPSKKEIRDWNFTSGTEDLSTYKNQSTILPKMKQNTGILIKIWFFDIFYQIFSLQNPSLASIFLLNESINTLIGVKISHFNHYFLVSLIKWKKILFIRAKFICKNS